MKLALVLAIALGISAQAQTNFTNPASQDSKLVPDTSSFQLLPNNGFMSSSVWVQTGSHEQELMSHCIDTMRYIQQYAYNAADGLEIGDLKCNEDHLLKAEQDAKDAAKYNKDPQRIFHISVDPFWTVDPVDLTKPKVTREPVVLETKTCSPGWHVEHWGDIGIEHWDWNGDFWEELHKAYTSDYKPEMDTEKNLNERNKYYPDICVMNVGDNVSGGYPITTYGKSVSPADDEGTRNWHFYYGTPVSHHKAHSNTSKNINPTPYILVTDHDGNKLPLCEDLHMDDKCVRITYPYRYGDAIGDGH